MRPLRLIILLFFFFSSRRRHTRFDCDWSSDVCSSDLQEIAMDDKTRTELEAAAFRRLVAHLQGRTDVQNIDLMNLAGFCRNCLSRWRSEERRVGKECRSRWSPYH